MKIILTIIISFLAFFICKAQEHLFPSDILHKENISLIKKYSECPGCNPPKTALLKDSIIVNVKGLVTLRFKLSPNGSINSKREYTYDNKGDYSVKTTVYPPIEAKDTVRSYIERFKSNRKGQLLKSLILHGNSSSLTELSYRRGKLVKELALQYSKDDLQKPFFAKKNFLSTETATRIKLITYDKDTTTTKMILNNENELTHVVISNNDSIIEREYDKNGVLKQTAISILDESDRISEISGSSLMIFTIPDTKIGDYRPFKQEYRYTKSGLIYQKRIVDNHQLSRIITYEYF